MTDYRCTDNLLRPLTGDVQVTVVLEVRASYVAVQADVAINERVESNRFRVGDVFHPKNTHRTQKSLRQCAANVPKQKRD